MTETKAISATITGRVQGVGFRYTTRRVGQDLGLVGWVRNQPDGSVATVAQGSERAIGRFVAFLEQGPPAAVVTSVQIHDVATDPTLRGFRVA